MSRVAVVDAREDVEAAVRRSVGLVGGLRLKGDEHVIIKPNVCNAKNPGGMVITDFRVIEAVVNVVKEHGNEVTVVESDNISGTAEKRVRGSGLLAKLEELGVAFLNLSHDDYVEHEVAGKRLRMPRTVMEADCFINLPKIKTCAHTLVTLSIKNLYGVFQRAKKSELHRHLDEVLPYLAKTVRHDLIVVDGLTCMEGNGPVVGNPREMGIIVAGVNPVSVDSVCASMMGYKPAEITHIARSHEQGTGEMSLDRIDLVGDDWRGFACEFERPYSLKATLRSIDAIRKVYLTRQPGGEESPQRSRKK